MGMLFTGIVILLAAILSGGPHPPCDGPHTATIRTTPREWAGPVTLRHRPPAPTKAPR